MDMTKKNYSFYMKDDYYEKLDKVKENNPALAPLSKSQATYFILSSLAANNTVLDINVNSDKDGQE